MKEKLNYKKELYNSFLAAVFAQFIGKDDQRLIII